MVKVTIQLASIQHSGFPSKNGENYILEYSFQHMPSSLPSQSQKMYSSEPELNIKWTKFSYNRGRSTREETDREAKHTKESNTGSTNLAQPNRYTGLIEEEREEQQ
jgi:hypothetical protein